MKIKKITAGRDIEIFILRLHKDIDNEETQISILKKTINNLIQNGQYHIIIDIINVHWLGLRTVYMIIEYMRICRDHCGDIKLINMLPETKKCLSLLDAFQFIQTCDNEAEALSCFKKSEKSACAYKQNVSCYNDY